MPTVEQLDQGVSVVREIRFASGAIGTEVVFTDPQLPGVPFWGLTSPNWILDIVHTIDPGAADIYTLRTTRQGKESKRWFTAGLQREIDTGKRPGIPVRFDPGQVQWTNEQTAGVSAAQNYLVMLQHEL